jgi:hypothetical protein
MDEKAVRKMLEQHFEYAGSDPARAHEMYHEDAVLEFPQSGERFVGVEHPIGARNVEPPPRASGRAAP